MDFGTSYFVPVVVGWIFRLMDEENCSSKVAVQAIIDVAQLKTVVREGGVYDKSSAKASDNLKSIKDLVGEIKAFREK